MYERVQRGQVKQKRTFAYKGEEGQHIQLYSQNKINTFSYMYSIRQEVFLGVAQLGRSLFC